LVLKKKSIYYMSIVSYHYLFMIWMNIKRIIGFLLISEKWFWIAGLKHCFEGNMGGDYHAFQSRTCWIATARIFVGCTWSYSKRALEFLQVHFLS
jgi:hypothetical protein